MKWEIDTVSEQLKMPWKINGADISKKDIFLIKFINGKFTGIGEVTYSSKENLTKETLANDLEVFYYKYKEATVSQFQDLTRLLDTIEFEYEAIRFAIESAFLDYLEKATEITKWRILGTNTISSVNSMVSIGLFTSTSEGEEVLKALPKSNILKVKISKETFKQQVEFINSSICKIVLDANESWGEDLDLLVSDLKLLNLDNILFIEQPFNKNFSQGHKKLKELNIIKVFLDESVEDHKHLNAFVDICDGIVLKSCKSKSIPRLLAQLTQARSLKLQTMLGCMVESTIGISSLFPVAYGFDYYDFDGFTKLNDSPEAKVFWDNGKVILSGMN